MDLYHHFGKLCSREERRKQLTSASLVREALGSTEVALDLERRELGCDAGRLELIAEDTSWILDIVLPGVEVPGLVVTGKRYPSTHEQAEQTEERAHDAPHVVLEDSQVVPALLERPIRKLEDVLNCAVLAVERGVSRPDVAEIFFVEPGGRGEGPCRSMEATVSRKRGIVEEGQNAQPPEIARSTPVSLPFDSNSPRQRRLPWWKS
jgi:hypothetical protein